MATNQSANSASDKENEVGNSLVTKGEADRKKDKETLARREATKIELRRADREHVRKTEERVYEKLPDFVNAGRNEAQKDRITRHPEETVQDNLSQIHDRLSPEWQRLVDSKDLGSFNTLWPGDTKEMTLVIGGIMGQDSTLSLPARGEIVKDVQFEGPNPNGLIVGFLRGGEGGAGKSAVTSLTWPEQMGIDKNGPQRFALALLSYSEKVAQLRAEGKIEKAKVMGTSLGGIGMMDSLGLLAEQGLLDTCINNLGPDAEIIIAQAPMHLRTGMNRADFLMNNAVVRSENLLYGVKAILAVDKEVRDTHIGSMIKAIINGDLDFLNIMLKQSQTVLDNREFVPEPTVLASEMIKSVSNFSLSEELKTTINPIIEKTLTYLRGQGIMRVNTVSGLYERMKYLNKLDLRSVNPVFSTEEKLGTNVVEAFKRNKTKIKLVYGSKIDKDVSFDQMGIAFQRLGILQSFTDRFAVENLDHFGLGNVNKSLALIHALGGNQNSTTEIRSVILNEHNKG